MESEAYAVTTYVYYLNKMKVLFIDTAHPLLEERLRALGFLCAHITASQEAALSDTIGAYQGIIIRSRVKVDKAFIDKAVNLKFIGRLGSGMESIDMAYAQSKGIACLNSPEGNRTAVGEHCLGMLLCLLNKIALSDAQIRRGIRMREANRGLEVAGKTIGIIGYGNMGSAFAKCLKGFDARVMAYDKYKKNFSDDFVTENTLNEVLENADIISLHVPLTMETQHMFGDNFISRMKKNFFLLNTARGKVVDTDALVKGMKKGKVLGAALDVIEYEHISFEELESQNLPPAYDYLLKAENTLLTPHIAGWTKESKIKMAQILADKIQALNLTVS